jgi:hypothetical protein
MAVKTLVEKSMEPGAITDIRTPDVKRPGKRWGTACGKISRPNDRLHGEQALNRKPGLADGYSPHGARHPAQRAKGLTR